MDTAEQLTPEELRRGLRKIRHRRWLLWILILIYLPLMMLALRSADPGHTVVNAFIAWVVALIVAVSLMALVRCPQCGNCFHMSGYLFRPVRRCFHCRLHLTADKRKAR